MQRKQALLRNICCVIMDSMPVEVTRGRLLTLTMTMGVAPDHATLRTAEILAADAGGREQGASAVGPEVWLLWAVWPESRRPDIHTAVLLPHMLVTCNCAATRFPCRHILALLLLDVAHPLPLRDPPGWAGAWADSALRGARGVSRGSEEGEDRRRAAAAAGMEELRRWLQDQVDRGLANMPRAGRRPWQDMANRLVDAYAPGVARELQELATLPGETHDWPERLLPGLGRLALMTEAFRRLDALPPGERGDLLTATGLPPRPAKDRVEDAWLVLGRRQTLFGRRRHQRTWLRGLRSDRWALVEEVRPARIDGACWPTGSVVSGPLAFLPSAWPLAAQPLEALRLTGERPAIEGGNIEAAVAGYAAARAANPWFRYFPMLLSGVWVEPVAGAWRLRDRGGRLLPLPPRFGYGWQLLALAAGRPLALFGEWDGTTFTPLSVNLAVPDGEWRDLAGWKAQT